MSANNRRLFLVTGANKGIGCEVVKKLSANHPNDLILLGSRDQKRGEDALVQLKSPANVKVLLLDTTSLDSIKHAKQVVEQKYGGKLDVLINNAGISQLGTDATTLQTLLDTNYYGVKNMNETFFPLIQDNGRVVNVSSGAGAQVMGFCPPELKEKLLSPEVTEKQLEEVLATWVCRKMASRFSLLLVCSLFKAAEQGQDPKTVGFEHPMHQLLVFYGVSKIAVNILTRIEARDWNYPAKNVIVSAICPDFCQTDMNGRSADARSPELGADSILHGVYDNDIENGRFWRDGRLFPDALEAKRTPLSPAAIQFFEKYEREQQQRLSNKH